MSSSRCVFLRGERAGGTPGLADQPGKKGCNAAGGELRVRGGGFSNSHMDRGCLSAKLSPPKTPSSALTGPIRLTRIPTNDCCIGPAGASKLFPLSSSLEISFRIAGQPLPQGLSAMRLQGPGPKPSRQTATDS